MATLVRTLGADPQRLERALLALEAIGWVGQVSPSGRGRARWALLVDPQAVTLAPLVDNLLLDRAAATRAGVPVAALLHADLIERPPLTAIDAEPPRSRNAAAYPRHEACREPAGPVPAGRPPASLREPARTQ